MGCAAQAGSVQCNVDTYQTGLKGTLCEGAKSSHVWMLIFELKHG